MKIIRLDSRGFTLVEMAIVLVVIGLLVGMGAGLIGPLTNRAKTSETRDHLSAISSSLQGFAASNNRLPTLLELPTIMKTPNDSWGGALQYITTNVLTTTPPSICNYRTTTLTLRICNDAACTTSTTINNIAYLVLSRGTNGNNQTAVTPAPLTNVPTTINTYLPGMAVDNYAGDINQPADEYDDILVWSTLDELRSKIGCQGAQLKIVNNELPPATVSSQYPNATAGAVVNFIVDGGATLANTMRWCIESTTAAPLPTGLSFTTTTPALPVRVTPANTCTSLAEASWGVVGSAPNLLAISGTPAAGSQGTYSFTVYVRDNNDTTGSNDNIASKTFVLTVNPQ